MIDSAILEEICLKQEKLAKHPERYEARQELVLESIRSLGDIYSFWIENPELRRDLLLEKKQPSTLRKMSRRGIRAVHNGWYYLTQIGKNRVFIKSFDEDHLKGLNGLVNNGRVSNGQFRAKDVTLTYQGYTPPSWERIPEKIKELIEKVREQYDKTPIDAAILAHLGISAIQPFEDGNKRCARLVQDRILFDLGLPSAIIPAGEGIFYRKLLGKTLPAYRDKIPEGQKEFYDYCASKINNGLDEMLGDLEEEPERK